MFKRMTKKKAFTLTELIVVIAIIGILAAVLIPSLTGYISKSKKSAAEQEAASVYQIYTTWLAEPAEDANSTQKVIDNPTHITDPAKTYFSNYYKLITGKDNITLKSVNFTEADGGTGFVLIASNGYQVTVVVDNGNVKYETVKVE